MKVAIIGSRTWKDYEHFVQVLESNKLEKITRIISGGQRTLEYYRGIPRYYGADYFAEKYAIEKQIPITIYHAEWDKYGKKAGPLRNIKIAEDCDYMIAFWENNSKGTSNAIGNARRLGKKVIIINPRGKDEAQRTVSRGLE